jgi:hypothetical protein
MTDNPTLKLSSFPVPADVSAAMDQMLEACAKWKLIPTKDQPTATTVNPNDTALISCLMLENPSRYEAQTAVAGAFFGIVGVVLLISFCNLIRNCWNVAKGNFEKATF